MKVLFTDSQNIQAIENDKIKILTVAQNKETERTALNSFVYKDKARTEITETCELDLLVLTALNCAENFQIHVIHIATLAEQCDMLKKQATLKRKQSRIVSHIEAKIERDKIQLSLSEKVIAINDIESQEHFSRVFESREYKEQLHTHANKLFELIDIVDDDHMQAIVENHCDFQRVVTIEYAHNVAILLNTEMTQAKAKIEKKRKSKKNVK